MVSETIQPLDSIGPVNQGKDDEIKDPARRDYIQGREEYTAGDFAAAAISFHNALRGFEEQGDQLGIANASDRLGDTCMAREEYEMALDHYKRARTICEQEEDSFSMLALHKKMAVCYRKLDRLDESLELLFDMLEHYQLTKNPKGAVDTLTVMAEVFIQQDRISDAAGAYRTISSIHANFKHKRLAEEFARRAEALDEE
jgi:tetratricopeptide (TPR) repeat protein